MIKEYNVEVPKAKRGRSARSEALEDIERFMESDSNSAEISTDGGTPLKVYHRYRAIADYHKLLDRITVKNVEGRVFLVKN